MYTKTTAMANTPYFVQLPMQENQRTAPHHRLMTIQKNYSDTFFQFKQSVKLTTNHGVALIVVTNDPHEPSQYETYVLHQAIQLAPGTFFNVLTITPQCSVYLEPTSDGEPKLINVSQPFRVNYLKEQLQINQLYGLFYQVKAAPDQGELTQQPDYYQMIIVDQGQINYQLNQQEITVKQHECLILFPNQSYTQQIADEGVTTYLTIMFDASGLDAAMNQQVYSLGNKYGSLMERLVKQANSPQTDYSGDLLLLDFKSLLLRLLQGDAAPSIEPTTSMRENYENELFQAIVDYLHLNVEERNEVNDLVDQFSLSRSTLQMLFKKYANTTPKSYINQLRLQRSKILIRESKMSLSEIASQLGYGSIQYFSRAFSREFGMNPSTYAKSLIQ